MFRTIILALIVAMQVMPADARIVRSAAAKAAFAKLHPCPATHKPIPHCPGYVIDHVKPLCAGGADKPSNMQWQTIAVGTKKDAIERRTCRLMHARRFARHRHASQRVATRRVARLRNAPTFQ
jgi:hypothetical protein